MKIGPIRKAKYRDPRNIQRNNCICLKTNDQQSPTGSVHLGVPLISFAPIGGLDWFFRQEPGVQRRIQTTNWGLQLIWGLGKSIWVSFLEDTLLEVGVEGKPKGKKPPFGRIPRRRKKKKNKLVVVDRNKTPTRL